MSVENFKWESEIACWARITNKYGELISYNLPRYHESYASLKYQGYITELLETKEYHVFIDCGAYMGLFSQVAAFNCSHVWAIEAHPIYFGFLLNNMKFLENVNCIYGFIGNDQTNPKIKPDLRNLVSASGEEYNIGVIVLDRMFENRDSSKKWLIKMDIEGNEFKALEGALELIKKPNIHWIIDVHKGHINVTIENIKCFFEGRDIQIIGKKVLVVK